MTTALSIPGEVYADAERLARRLKRSRSRLYADAMREYVARHDPDAVTEALNRVCETGGREVDPFVSGAAARTLAQVEW
jgi:predicted transcriptional regulator